MYIKHSFPSHNLHKDTEARRTRQQQQANAYAAAEAALQAQHEKTTRQAGNNNGGATNTSYYSIVVRCNKLFNREIRRMSVGVLETKSHRIYIF